MLLRLLVTLTTASLLPTVLATTDPKTTLECHRRDYTYKATRTDLTGRQCWDYLRVMSCWGRCDSGEIADWRFPYKKSFHPVCMHEQKRLRRILLRHCDPDADPELRHYEYYEAMTCSCQICETSTASCEGIPFRGTAEP